MNTWKRQLAVSVVICLFALAAAARGAGGQYVKVDYPASTAPGELQIAVTYTIWIPDGVPRLRGVIVHQHGAGTTASIEGSTAAYDLHWQALRESGTSRCSGLPTTSRTRRSTPRRGRRNCGSIHAAGRRRPSSRHCAILPRSPAIRKSKPFRGALGTLRRRDLVGCDGKPPPRPRCRRLHALRHGADVPEPSRIHPARCTRGTLRHTDDVQSRREGETRYQGAA